jgi:cullin-associated NEDD8-dissociated protein 1
VKEHVSTPALVLSTSPLLQDSALVSLLAFLEQMVISEAIDFQELLQLLRSRAETEERLSKLPLSSLAQSIAVITAATTPENREGVISDLLKSLEGASDAMDEASTRQMILSLRASGDLGRVVDYSSMDGVAERFQAVYLGSFDYSSEEIKHAGAYALGRAAMGAQAVLLPAIVDALEKNNQKKQYLLLSALREFIQCHLKTSGDAIVPSVPVILPHLINHCADEQESVRTMVADCMGALTCLQPAGMLVTLRDLIAEHSEIEAPGGHVAEGDEKSRVNALACWTALSSIKLAIAGKASASDLAAFMPDFLKLLDVEELSVRNAALLMVYSSVHHMPQLVSGMMSELIVPRLQEVSADGFILFHFADCLAFSYQPLLFRMSRCPTFSSKRWSIWGLSNIPWTMHFHCESLLSVFTPPVSRIYQVVLTLPHSCQYWPRLLAMPKTCSSRPTRL